MARIDWIDGLRGVAILSVIGFHAGAPGFSGGFTAIDVFFVISGFLICGQIVDSVRDGTFSFAEFYARRVARIFPPLLLVVSAVLVAAPLLPLLPSEVDRIASSGRAATAMVSNWYFLQSGAQYFWPAAERDVFLHTWSLGVEEQFYLTAPAFMVLVHVIASRRGIRPLRLWIVTSVVIVVSSFVATALFGLADSKQMLVYYSTPTRVWELAAGGLVALLVRQGVRPSSIVSELTSVAGLAIIIGMVAWAHPDRGNRAFLFLLPALGTCALLLAGQSHSRALACRALAFKPLAGLGLVSYGYYLWHWPIPALMRLTQLEPLTPRQIVGGMVVAPLLLGIATYWSIERPLRTWRRHQRVRWRPRLVVAGGLAACGVLAAAASIVVAWSEFRSSQPEFRGYEVFQDVRLACPEGLTDDGQPRCSIGASPIRRAVVWGDSHAISLIGATASAAMDASTSAHVLWAPGCPPTIGPVSVAGTPWESCRRHNAKVLRWLQSPDASGVTAVVLVGRWATSGLWTAGQLSNDLRATVDALRELGLRVLVVGPFPVLPLPAPECVFHTRDRDDSNICSTPSVSVHALHRSVLAELTAAVAGFTNAVVIDSAAAFCDDTWCRPTRKDEILYSDNHHLSRAGSRRLYALYKPQFSWAFEAQSRTQAGEDVAFGGPASR